MLRARGIPTLSQLLFSTSAVAGDAEAVSVSLDILRSLTSDSACLVGCLSSTVTDLRCSCALLAPDRR